MLDKVYKNQCFSKHSAKTQTAGHFLLWSVCRVFITELMFWLFLIFPTTLLLTKNRRFPDTFCVERSYSLLGWLYYRMWGHVPGWALWDTYVLLPSSLCSVLLCSLACGRRKGNGVSRRRNCEAQAALGTLHHHLGVVHWDSLEEELRRSRHTRIRENCRGRP